MREQGPMALAAAAAVLRHRAYALEKTAQHQRINCQWLKARRTCKAAVKLLELADALRLEARRQ